MMRHEFDEIAGYTCDSAMYANEIEPTYMMFDKISKQGLAKAYWGEGDRRVARDGGYGLWTRLNDLRKELDKLSFDKTHYMFRENVVKAAELFKESDEIIEKMNRL